MSAGSNVVLVSNHNNRVAFGMEPFEKIHDFHAGMSIERTCRFVSKRIEGGSQVREQSLRVVFVRPKVRWAGASSDR